MVPACGYRVEGIDRIRLLDFDDFDGFDFDGLYDSCRVTGIRQMGVYVEVDCPEGAAYSSSLQNGVYTHTLETFAGDLSAELQGSLHLATTRRYIVVFSTKGGGSFVFGYEAGATVTYTNHTGDGYGSDVVLSSTSVYPLFEITGTEEITTVRWEDFVNVLGEEGVTVSSEWRDFVNVLEEREDGIEIWGIEIDFIVS